MPSIFSFPSFLTLLSPSIDFFLMSPLTSTSSRNIPFKKEDLPFLYFPPSLTFSKFDRDSRRNYSQNIGILLLLLSCTVTGLMTRKLFLEVVWDCALLARLRRWAWACLYASKDWVEVSMLLLSYFWNWKGQLYRIWMYSNNPAYGNDLRKKI